MPSATNNLSNRHYVTLIVRLNVDDHRQLICGEMVDDTQTFRKRFSGASGLIRAVEAWLARDEADDAGIEEVPE